MVVTSGDSIISHDAQLQSSACLDRVCLVLSVGGGSATADERCRNRHPRPDRLRSRRFCRAHAAARVMDELAPGMGRDRLRVAHARADPGARRRQLRRPLERTGAAVAPRRDSLSLGGQINLEPASSEREANARELVKQKGPHMSVFGRRYNDHRWLEVLDERSNNGRRRIPRRGSSARSHGCLHA